MSTKIRLEGQSIVFPQLIVSINIHLSRSGRYNMIRLDCFYNGFLADNLGDRLMEMQFAESSM